MSINPPILLRFGRLPYDVLDWSSLNKKTVAPIKWVATVESLNLVPIIAIIISIITMIIVVLIISIRMIWDSAISVR